MQTPVARGEVSGSDRRPSRSSERCEERVHAQGAPDRRLRVVGRCSRDRWTWSCATPICICPDCRSRLRRGLPNHSRGAAHPRLLRMDGAGDRPCPYTPAHGFESRTSSARVQRGEPARTRAGRTVRVPERCPAGVLPETSACSWWTTARPTAPRLLFGAPGVRGEWQAHGEWWAAGARAAERAAWRQGFGRAGRNARRGR